MMRLPDGALCFAYILLLVPLPGLACDFPEFLQSKRDGPKRAWHVEHMETHRGREHRYTHIVTFLGSTMHAEVGDNKHKDHVHNHPKSYTRRCVLEIEPGQFLVTHNVIGGSIQHYSCLEFIKRSDNVFQIKQSELSEVQDPRLCSDKFMTVSNWPFINKADLFSTYEPCPLEGGYEARFFDKKKHVGYCDVYEGETRIESECMKGEGMFFRFRYDECVPEDLPMNNEQQLYCMANWHDEHFTYSILRHNSKDHQWCLRLPKSTGSKFNALLFRDVVCDTNFHPIETSEYYTISMFRDKALSISDLCRDDYEGCSYWSTPCETPGSDSFMTCAKMCNLCNQTRPATCSLPLSLRGEWLESNRLGHDIVDIKDTGFSKYQYDHFKCVQWHDKPYERNAHFAEEMMVTTLDNGCRPRFTCAQFRKHSPSVLHYKLSIAKVWPFYGTDWEKIDCSSFKYKDEDEPAGDAHRSRHFKALVSMDSITNVNCNLNGPLDFTMVDENGISCHGMLTEDNDSIYRHKHLQLLLYDCPNRKAQQTFACLDSNRHGYISKHIIITEAVDNTNEYQCWLFPTTPEHMIYLLPMRHCHEAAAEQILSGKVTPLSSFRITVTTTRPTTTTTTTTTPQPSPQIIVENIVSIPTPEEEIDYDYDYRQLNDFLIRMNDMSKPVEGSVEGTRKPLKKVPQDRTADSYSLLAHKDNEPEEGKLVSAKSDSNLEAAPQHPEATVNKRQETRYTPPGSSASALSYGTIVLISAAMFTLIH